MDLPGEVMDATEIAFSRLSSAILHTVAYADIFDFPLIAAEIHRYLAGVRASREAVDRRLQEIPALSRIENCYTLPGRESLVHERRRRERDAGRLWPRALFYGEIIARLPFVRMVAVTGALAMNNVTEEADIDYLLVTEPGRLWFSRALVLLVGRVAARQGATLCPNYLVSLRSLEFPDRTLYAAREVAQMVPIAGLDVYQRIRMQNSWVERFLPNAQGLPEAPWISTGPVSSTPARRRMEAVLRTRPFTSLERWEMNRKIRKLRAQQGASPESHFSADCCKGHAYRHQERTRVRLDERLKRLQQEYL